MGTSFQNIETIYSLKSFNPHLLDQLKKMAPQVAWIGLGNMGRGMCKNLVEKGQLDKPLIIFNRTEKRATDLSKSLPSGKSTVASSIEELVSESDIVFTCVGDDEAINSTIDVAVKAGVKGKLLVDCSTVHPETSEGLAKKVTEAGGEFVACPVFGAPAMADNGQLVCVLAGPKESVQKVMFWQRSPGSVPKTFISSSRLCSLVHTRHILRECCLGITTREKSHFLPLIWLGKMLGMHRLLRRLLGLG